MKFVIGKIGQYTKETLAAARNYVDVETTKGSDGIQVLEGLIKIDAKTAMDRMAADMVGSYGTMRTQIDGINSGIRERILDIEKDIQKVKASPGTQRSERSAENKGYR